MLLFLRENIRWLGAGFAMLFASSFGQTFFISLSGGEIRRELDLSDGQFGLVYMAVTLASAFSLVWLGKLLDAKAVRSVVAMAVLALAAGQSGLPTPHRSPRWSQACFCCACSVRA